MVFSCFRGKAEQYSLGPLPEPSCSDQQRCKPKKCCTPEISEVKCSTYTAPDELPGLTLGATACIVQHERPVNDALIKLAQVLPTLDGGWWSALSEACHVTCEQLSADHACVFVLSCSDLWATAAACSGAGEAATVGRAYSCDPRFNGSAAAVILRAKMDKAGGCCVIRSLPLTSSSACSGDIPVAASRPAVVPSSSDDLPGDWQVLFEEYGCRHFAAVPLGNAEGEVVGVLSVASKGATLPACWTPEALYSIVGLLAPSIRRAQTVLASPALSQLHAAATLSDLIQATGEAAIDAAAAVAHTRGSSRVAVIQADVNAAAIFQHQLPPQEGEQAASIKQLLKARRSSCEFISMPASVRKSTTPTPFARISMDVCPNPAPDRTISATPDFLKGESWTPARMTNLTATNTWGNTISFSFPSGKGAPCKGHTLGLDKTLLGEALSKQVAGLCIDDCQAYTVRTKAYPRDLILSRGAVMPMSLALAAIAVDGKPLMALYVTFATTLPRPMLQAVVQELQQLLQASLPILRSKLGGVLRSEYDILVRELEVAATRRAQGRKTIPPEASRFANTGTSSIRSIERSGHADSQPPGGAGSQQPSQQEERSHVEGGSHRVVSFILQSAVPGAKAPAGQGAASCKGGTVTAAADPPGGPCATVLTRTISPPQPGGLLPPGVSPPSLGDRASPTCAPGTPLPLRSANDNDVARRVVSFCRAPANVIPEEGADQTLKGCQHDDVAGDMDMAASTCDDGDGSPKEASAVPPGFCLRPASTAPGGRDEGVFGRVKSAAEVAVPPNRRLLHSLRSVSFHLERAQPPRGASRLAPIIASVHDRLKAAQSLQMTLGRSESRKADLQSVKLLQEIGQGGYGTVYRGTYHGAEVAVKLIKQSRLAAVASSSNALGSHSAGLGLHKQHLHDAIELVASVSMSHINIVQVPAYFMDVKLEKPDEFNPLDSVDQPTESRPFRLLHSPSLIESPAPGQDGIGLGEGAMALVLEYCDCGSLCDAIMGRRFIEKFTPKSGPHGGTGKTYLAINMRSVYSTLLEIALALRHMHSLALVHCDLKPQNVLLKSTPRDPRGFTAKLSDFGLAKMMAHDDEGHLVIDDAVASGTITHVAPEVLLGENALGASVDIYAFGILMYQVLCGMKVYDKAMSPSSIANAVAHRRMRPKLPSWVPASYRQLAEACWEQCAADRPTTDQLVRGLERALEAKKTTSRTAQPQQSQPQLQ